MKLRDIPHDEKEAFSGIIPVAVAVAARKRATEKRWSLSEVLTEGLCLATGLDGSKYGVGDRSDRAPEKPSRKPRRAARAPA